MFHLRAPRNVSRDKSPDFQAPDAFSHPCAEMRRLQGRTDGMVLAFPPIMSTRSCESDPGRRAAQARPFSRRRPMPGSIRKSGICSTCKCVSTCIYPRGPRSGVLQCEEFEPSEPQPASKTPKSVSRTGKPLPAPGAGRQAHAQLRGLCADCENRSACTYPKTDAGVWRCEEYQ